MMINFFTFALLLFQTSDPVLVKETWEDGSPRLEYQVQETPGEEPVRNGDFKRWYQNGELAEKGKYRKGKKSGQWYQYYESGRMQSQGPYRRDIQSGKWKFFYPSKVLMAAGELSDGIRFGHWDVWLEDGTEDLTLTGEYKHFRSKYDSGQLRSEGMLLDRLPIGPWRYWWENGTTQIEGEYQRGKKNGVWKFWHMDGTQDFEMLAGNYKMGERVASTPEVESKQEGPESIIWRPMEAVVHKNSDDPAISLWKSLNSSDSKVSAIAKQDLIALGPEAMPVLISELQQLNLDSEQDAKAGARAHSALTGIFHGAIQAWSDGVTKPSVQSNQMAVRRWTSLWMLSKDDEFFWKLELATQPRVSQAVLLEPMLPVDVSSMPPQQFASRFTDHRKDATHEAIRDGLKWLREHQAASGAWGSASFKTLDGQKEIYSAGDVGKEYYDVGVTSLALLAFMAEGNTMADGFDQKVVSDGIFWLIQQQSLDGVFDWGIGSAGMSKLGGGDWKIYRCQACDGDGVQPCPKCATVGRLPNGATCNLCKGNLPSCETCEGSQAVWKRLAVTQNDKVLIEKRPVRYTSRVKNLYNQALGTMALCEAFSTCKDPRLQDAAEKALHVLLEAQNPYSAWGSTLEPSGENFTAISTWIGCTLITARNAGMEIPPKHFRGAMEWLATMTDRGTGRTGFSFGKGGGPGGMSPRLEGFFERYPPEKSEALSAAALWCKLYYGGIPKTKKGDSKYELLKRQADLIVFKSAVWDDGGGSIDLFYWHFGSLAMNSWGGAHSKSWGKSVRKALIPNQRVDTSSNEFSGSWDPIGAWGSIGGRVYSTAMATLTLQANYRYQL